ncbi:unnamed protein product, partial [marine sediment metagenome]
MEVEFIKLQSCGKDYILLDPYKTPVLANDILTDLAAQITSRHFGVGAEGLLLLLPTGRGTEALQPSQTATPALKMLCLGPDGSEEVPSPLALRCMARYAFDSGLTPGEIFTIQTGSESQTIEVIDSRNIITRNGPPRYWDLDKELKERTAEGFTRTLTVEERDYNYIPVRLEKPHAVFFFPDYSIDDREFREGIESSGFTRETAVELVRVFSRDKLNTRVWEEGMCESMASESGACAAVVASVLNGFT